MKYNKKIICNGGEPVYDDDMLGELKEYETKELLSALVDHILEMQDEIVSLRKTLYGNNPHTEICSDLCPSFEDFTAYEKYAEIMNRLL